MSTRKTIKQNVQELLAEVKRLRDENNLLREERSHDATIESQNNLDVSGSRNGDSLVPTTTSGIEKGNSSVLMGINELSVFIPEFNPQKDANLSAVNWVSSIDKLKSNYLWTDQSTLFYASLRLGGPARF